MVSIISCGDKNEIVPINENEISKAFTAGDAFGDAVFHTIIDDIHINVTRTDSSAIIYGSSHFIDLRNDFSMDLSLNVISIGFIDDYSTNCYFKILDNIEICLADNDTSNIKLLQEGDTIGSAGNWHGTTNKRYYLANYYFKSQDSIIITDSTSGQWNDVIDGYMAIRDIKENDTTYGWMKLDLTENYDLLMKSYAIENN